MSLLPEYPAASELLRLLPVHSISNCVPDREPFPTISWAQARRWPVPGPAFIPHRPPSCVFGEGMTVHGGAQLHDVIRQGRHSLASFWRPLT
jgi:hypothetical protein